MREKVCGNCRFCDESEGFCLLEQRSVEFSEPACDEFIYCDGSCSSCRVTYEFWRVQTGDAVLYFDTHKAAADYIDQLHRVAKALKTDAPAIDLGLWQFIGEPYIEVL